ncbi:hypothetical protein [Streptosporangium sp. NPDC002721]|uniref:hypothetical protein n=1 Tax=Streptosporangium sp. NPDC002721 TaxID=3366188 RepID=UPI0036C51515
MDAQSITGDVAMRAAMDGTPHQQTAVGTVIGHDLTANEGVGCVIVRWPGADGFTGTYPPDALVRVERDSDGIPRAI